MQSVFCKYKSSNKLYLEEWLPSPRHKNKIFHFVKNFSYSLYFFSYVNLGFFFFYFFRKETLGSIKTKVPIWYQSLSIPRRAILVRSLMLKTSESWNTLFGLKCEV